MAATGNVLLKNKAWIVLSTQSYLITGATGIPSFAWYLRINLRKKWDLLFIQMAHGIQELWRILKCCLLFLGEKVVIMQTQAQRRAPDNCYLPFLNSQPPFHPFFKARFQSIRSNFPVLTWGFSILPLRACNVSIALLAHSRNRWI